MALEMLKNNYSFEKRKWIYKRIDELEEKLNDKRYEYPIIDVEVQGWISMKLILLCYGSNALKQKEIKIKQNNIYELDDWRYKTKEELMCNIY